MYLKIRGPERSTPGHVVFQSPKGKEMFLLKTGATRQAGPIALAFSFAALWVVSVRGAKQSGISQLRKHGTATQLLVDGKPFLILGGELGNSSSSSLEHLSTIWPKIVSLNLNTVLVPVYWDLIEPAEGLFDFSVVDGLIQEARRYILNVTNDRPSSSTTQGVQTSDPISGGLAIAVGPDEFIFAGIGLTVTFEANTSGPRSVGILSVQEGKYINSQWQPERRLNGDQTHQGRHLRLPSGKFALERIKLYRYR